jgi:hypothetical protein
MPTYLRPFTVEDVPLMMDIQRSALCNGIWASVWQPGVYETFVESQKDAVTKPTSKYFGVVDEALDHTTIAAGRFMVYENGRTEEEIEKSLQMPAAFKPGMAMRDIFGLVNGWRKEFMGTKPCIRMS